ncbi:uncharacterized protein LOC117320539 [Pecten maximus]|uniref:uncharacterized protein LOC117320539 n=1 Tax=Pecten maximus TaxID=6579 RepID=UPI001458089A|nr:uncharacterized protein LOC117320539 [Pecten maximus]
MCTARNIGGESTIMISVTVQCEPLPYQIPDEIQTIDLATSENLTIPALFTSNPSSSFMWTFQLSESRTSTQLVNGDANVLIQNTFETKNLTAVSTMTRTDIQQNWFGLYNVTATNTHGSATLSFIVHEKRYPGFPNNLLIGCTKPHSAEVSWGGGGDSQYYHVMFSTDKFLNSQEVYPVTITKHTDGSDVYILNIDNLDGSRVYFFKVVAYNQYGNTTSAEAVGCTVQEPVARCSDSMFVAGIVLNVIAVVMVLFTVGLGVFIRRNGQLPFVKGRRKQEEFKNVQFSKRDGTHEKDDERFQSEQFDVDGIAKVSTYSEIGGQNQVYQNNPVNGGDDG